MNCSLMLSVMVVLAGFTLVSSIQLSCDHILRRLPSYAYLFTHCNCLYSNWTEWVAINRTAVNISQCSSGSALIYERKQLVISGECDDRKENTTICEPEMIDRLILALGIGSSGQDVTPGPSGPPGEQPSVPPDYQPIPPPTPGQPVSPGPPGQPASPGLPGQPASPGDFDVVPATISPTEDRDEQTTMPPRNQDQICHHVTVPHFTPDRRSVGDEMEESQVDQEFEEITEFEQLPIDPKPFNLVEHKARYRRDDHCPLQHILFVLDTSGSIGEDDFNTVTTVLGSLVPLFCKPIKIAAMTFDHEYYVEFCFDEYDNSALGRYLAGEALWSIPYIRPGQSWGSRYTHTAGAAQCVCDYIFRDRGCGIGSTAAPCVDVVFFTDGHANDPVQNVCETVQCLHDIRNVNTYTISVGNPYQLKLDCMEENNLRLDEYHLFNFKSISDLENQLNLIIHRLITNPISYECASTFSDPRV